MPPRITLTTLLLLALALGGCASARVTDPPRTATEQFLLSKAAAEAVSQLSFGNLRGRRVFVDTQYFAASEQAFVLGELRARLLLSGVQLVEHPDAEIVLEVRSGGVGIDRNDYLIGLPAIVLAGDRTPTPDTSQSLYYATPELAAVKNIEQRGVAAVAYVAYWAATGEIVSSSGPFVGRTLRDDWWFFGVGPRTIGDIPTTERGDPLEPLEPEPPPPVAEPEPDAPVSAEPREPAEGATLPTPSAPGDERP